LVLYIEYQISHNCLDDHKEEKCIHWYQQKKPELVITYAMFGKCSTLVLTFLSWPYAVNVCDSDIN
jgi:acyl-coenzyme A synthetase/AMP-(fatty) acid ligase